MKNFWIIVAALALVGCCPKAAQHNTSRVNKLPSTGQMPILAWYSIPSDCTTLERFKEMRAAGITHHFTGYPDIASMDKALDIAQKTGVKVIVSCPELEKDPENTVRYFMSHPATAGYFLRDEPATPSFGELGKWARRIQSVDSKHLCYLNLLPTYAPLEALVATSYRDYVHRFINEVPMPMLSFDHYPIVGDTYRGDWYENLEIFSDEARAAGKPFWAFALTTAHDPYPMPDLAMLRFEMYSNLAYGAQGLQYFTYWTPGKNPNWNFHHGPIGLDSKRTDVYDKMKAMNTEIQNLSGVFLGAKVIGVHHTGDAIPTGTKRLEQMPSGFTKLSTIGAGAVVSELENGAHRFVVIVNRDFKNRMQLDYAVAPTAQRILKDASIVPASTYSNTLMVEPGDAVIFMIK